MSTAKPLGVYVHVPFCEKKCPYCDFYSAPGNEKKYNDYTGAVVSRIRSLGEKLGRRGDTLYFGGGTPSLLGEQRLCEMISAAKDAFGNNFSEITIEVNPTRLAPDFTVLKSAGVNRISVGLQSADENELRALGRMHTCEDALRCIAQAHDAGIDNVSADLMLAVPHQTTETLRRSIKFCIDAGVSHISAYILKIEPGTVFAKKQNELSLPDDDEAAELYETLCSELRGCGWRHYEISNFCRDDMRGLHNLKYWHDEEYIGIGPSAHSFIGGKRFFTPRRMQSFLDGITVDDGEGGTEEEYIMLALRLDEGVRAKAFCERFRYDLPGKYLSRAAALQSHGLVTVSSSDFSLTEKGFLLSNSIIAELLR